MFPSNNQKVHGDDKLHVYSVTSNKQNNSHRQYLNNELEDDFAASAISLDINSSAMQKKQQTPSQVQITSFSGQTSAMKKGMSTSTPKQSSFVIDAVQNQNDLENPWLFKKKTKSRLGLLPKDSQIESVLQDKTN